MAASLLAVCSAKIQGASMLLDCKPARGELQHSFDQPAFISCRFYIGWQPDACCSMCAAHKERHSSLASRCLLPRAQSPYICAVCFTSELGCCAANGVCGLAVPPYSWQIRAMLLLPPASSHATRCSVGLLLLCDSSRQRLPLSVRVASIMHTLHTLALH